MKDGVKYAIVGVAGLVLSYVIWKMTTSRGNEPIGNGAFLIVRRSCFGQSCCAYPILDLVDFNSSIGAFVWPNSDFLRFLIEENIDDGAAVRDGKVLKGANKDTTKHIDPEKGENVELLRDDAIGRAKVFSDVK